LTKYLATVAEIDDYSRQCGQGLRITLNDLEWPIQLKVRFTDGTLDVGNYPEFSYSHSSSTVVCFSVCNVALNRPSYQSSAHYRGDPRHGNDGTWMNLTAWPDPRCTHSWRETNPWWGVDLGVPLTVREIFLTNRLEISTGELTLHLSCSARAKRTLFSAKSARTLTHFFT